MQAELLDQFDKATVQRIRRILPRWFSRHGRSLPWRETRDPYRIWISEIMLQQTTVKAVIPYFERFLTRFPTLADLADASEEEVLRAWEGLGYYSRGRNLRKAAREIVTRHRGVFPEDLQMLQDLPGIGRYTAGAIASFAFDRPAPIVEANTLRLYCRLLGFGGNTTSSAGQKLLWAFAEQLQPRRGSGILNQALMETGARVCTPVDPNCPECPLKFCCRAFEQGMQSRIPAPKARPEVTAIVEGTVALRYQGKVLLRQRSESERWAGLWDFPRLELKEIPHRGKLAQRHLDDAGRQISVQLQPEIGIRIRDLPLISEIRHSVTRYRIRLLCFSSSVTTEVLPGNGTWKWVTLTELKEFPLSVTGREFAETLAESLQQKTLF